jgi:hypothetical protein
MLTRISRLTLTAAATVAFASAPAWADTGPWEQSLGIQGGATVNSDADKITVCDNLHDTTFVKAEYYTSYHQTWTVKAAQGECDTGHTWISLIKSFRVCSGHKSWDGSVIWDGCTDRVAVKK